MENEMITVVDSNGASFDASLVTYLVSDDYLNKYVVYSKGERTGANNDEVIYISKLLNDGDKLQIQEIVDNDEWLNVQLLLKRIANAN